MNQKPKRKEKTLFEELKATLPSDAIVDFGEGPMVYLGDDVYVKKDGSMYLDK